MEGRFYTAYAEALREIIISLVSKHCPGCQNPSLPSKREDHFICEGSAKEIVRNYFHDAWEELKEDDVYAKLDSARDCPIKTDLNVVLYNYKYDLEGTVCKLLELIPMRCYTT